MYPGRLTALRKAADSEAILLTGREDIFYYTGHTVTDDESCFLLVFRSGKPVLYVSPLMGPRNIPATVRFLQKGKLLSELKGRTVAFDENTLSSGVYLALKKQAKLVPAAKRLFRPRETKSPAEVDALRGAIRAAGKGFSDALRELKPGRTERQVAAAFDRSAALQGARPSFSTIVACAANAGTFIHHQPRETRIRKRDLVIVDFGAKTGGYCSDTTRMVAINPTPAQKKLVETVSRIQQELIDFLEPGKPWREIQNQYERLAKQAGFRTWHGFGHGIGLAVHEPWTELKPGVVTTVEPGIYLPKVGGCRIEDMVLVRKGKREILTRHIPDSFR